MLYKFLYHGKRNEKNTSDDMKQRKKGSRGCIILLLLICLLIMSLAVSAGLISAPLIFRKETIKAQDQKDISDESLKKSFINMDTSALDISGITDTTAAIRILKDRGESLGYKNAFSDLSSVSANVCDGTTYYRLQENYNGMPVFGRMAIAWTDASGKLIRLTGNAIDINEEDNYSAGITKETALESIKQYCTETKITDSETKVKVDEELSDLEIYTFLPDKSAETVYKEFVNFSDGGNYEALVNAVTSEVISFTDLTEKLEEEDPVSIAVQGKDAVENIDVSKTKQNVYNLFDRGRKIYVRRATTDDIVSGNVLDGTAAIEWANNDEIGQYKEEVSAMANAEKISDCFNKAFGFLKDGVERTVVVITNTEKMDGKSYIDNACSKQYPGTDQGKRLFCLFIGRNLDCSEIDIIGHEFAHGFIWTIGDIPQGGDSGAINEGLGDIFGEFAEYEKNGNCDWKNIDRNYADPLGNKGRDGAEPAKMYGEYWMIANHKYLNWKYDFYRLFTLTEDIAHNNSTILSHAAYLMSQGIPDVQGSRLSMEQVENVWGRAVAGMVNCYNTFSNLRDVAVTSADYLKKSGELTAEQLACVKWAFDEVGIQGEDSDNESQWSEDIPEENTAESSTASSENKESDYMSQYKSIFDEYERYEKDTNRRDNFKQYPDVSYEIPDDRIRDLQYSLTDITGDGIPELIVADQNKEVYGDYFGGCDIYGVYGIVNGKPKSYFYNGLGYRDVISLHDKNIIREYGSGGARDADYKFYTLNSDGSIGPVISEFVLDGDKYYRISNDKSRTEITEEEYVSNQYKYPFRTDLQWKPLF